MGDTEPQAGANDQPRRNLSPADESLIMNLVAGVERRIVVTNEVLQQASDLAVMSNSLQVLKGMDSGILKVARELGIVTFAFTPPLEVPSYLHEKKFSEDPRSNQVTITLGRHLHDAMVQKGKSILTEQQFYAADAEGIALGRPLALSISVIGGCLFDTIDRFDRTGAVIGGIPNDKIRAIDLKAVGPEIMVVRPLLEKSSVATETITLPMLDEWRLTRLKAVGSQANELGDQKQTLQLILGGVILDRIFPDSGTQVSL